MKEELDEGGAEERSGNAWKRGWSREGARDE